MADGTLVLLTVPHVCVESPFYDPGCDQDSLKYAKAIQSGLGRSNLLLTSITPRHICDNNRKPCRRKTRLRKRLTALLDILQELDKPLLGLDIHTFHQESDFDLPSQPQYQVLVLDTRKRPSTKLLIQLLQEQGLNVRYVRGGKINDIQAQLQGRGISTPLLEIRTGLDEREIAKVSQGVAEWADLISSA